MAETGSKIYRNKKTTTESLGPSQMACLRDIYNFCLRSGIDMERVFLAFLDPTDYVGIQLAVKKIKEILNEQQTLRNLH